MEKLSQVLLDFHTWKRPSAEGGQSGTCGGGGVRESIL